MFASTICVLFGLLALTTSAPTPDLAPNLETRSLGITLPSDFSISKTYNITAIPAKSVYAAILTTLLTLAYDDPRGSIPPTPSMWGECTLELTGADPTARVQRQYATYLLYAALDTISASNSFFEAAFVLQNANGVVAKLSLTYKDLPVQPIPGGAIAGRSPALNPRDEEASESSPLSAFTENWSQNWFGNPSSDRNFFLALATLITKSSNVMQKGMVVDTVDTVPEGYRLSVTNVPLPKTANLLSYRGVLDLCARAFKVGLEKEAKSGFEETLLWIDGHDGDEAAKWVLRYEGAV